MATYASTLVIKHRSSKSDAEIIRSMALYKRDQHNIGEENTSYQAALGNDRNSIYVTSIRDFVIIVGHPLVSDFMYGNAINGLFPDAEYFLFFSNSTSMLNGFVWGKGDRVYRRKYVQDGKYVKSYDFGADVGDPLKQEEKFTIFSDNKPVYGNRRLYVWSA